MANKAVFVDRDNTLIEDPGYISDPSLVRLLPGVELAIKSLSQQGFKVVVVTNQSGIARGLLSEEALGQIHRELGRQLGEHGANLDGIYYCPFHPEGTVEKYTCDSELRKPKPGMLLAAAKDLDIDLAASWMVGDSPRDIEAGQRAGCRTIRVRTQHDPASGENSDEDSQADYTVRNLVDAAKVIIRENKAGPGGQRAGSVSDGANERALANESANQESLPQADNREATPERQAASQTVPQEEPAKTAPPDAAVVEPGSLAGETPATRAGAVEAPATHAAAGQPSHSQAHDYGADPLPPKHVVIGSRYKSKEPKEPVFDNSIDRELGSSGQTLKDILTGIQQIGRAVAPDGGGFCFSKMAAGIVQILAILMLAVAFWKMCADQLPAAQVYATLGVALQAMALTFFVMFRNK
jgi:D-glycero-D-manno-heptose 1,7-bisphosphate phosphatase